MSLGSKIKNLRRMRGMTQSVLADGIVTHGMLSRIEHDDAIKRQLKNCSSSPN